MLLFQANNYLHMDPHGAAAFWACGEVSWLFAFCVPRHDGLVKRALGKEVANPINVGIVIQEVRYLVNLRNTE